MAGLAGYVRHGVLSNSGILVACRTLAAYRALLDNFSVRDMHVFATASLRNITNTAEAVQTIRDITGITVEVLNTTDLDISSGNEALLGLQMELGGQWYWLNAFPGGIAATMEAYLYSSGSPRELELDWGRSYGPLWPGHYRVTKWFSAEQPSGGHTDFLLAAEFTLG